MKKINYLYTVLLSLFGVVFCASCSDELEIAGEHGQLTEDDFKYEYTLSILPEETATRSFSSDWADGTVLYCTFDSPSGYILGKATYSKSADTWSIATNSALTNEGYQCSLYYFENLPANAQVSMHDDYGNNQWIIETNQFTIPYVLESNYKIVGNNVTVCGNLSPRESIRFKGAPGTKIEIVNGAYGQNDSFCSQMYLSPWSWFNYGSSNEWQPITIGSDGYSQYVYLPFANYSDNSNTLYIKVNNDDIFAHELYSDMFIIDENNNRTKRIVFNTPSADSHKGWGLLRQIDGNEYLLYEEGNATLCKVSNRETVTSFIVPSSVYYKRKDYTITAIGNAFQHANQLQSVTLPNTITHLYSDTFWGCNNLTSIQLPNSLQYIGNSCFGATGLTEVNIPNSVTYLGQNSFGSCSNLHTVYLPEGIEELQGSTFNYCTSLSTIVWPANSNIKRIEYSCFRYTDLTEITIPEGVQRIANDVFSDCYKLKKVSFPSTLKSIDTNVFMGSSSLEELTLNSKHLSIRVYDNTFDSSIYSTCKLYVFGPLVNQYKANWPWNNFANIVAIPGTENAQSTAGNYVDLGLPSGTLWADRNVGAYSVEDGGEFYAWGETETKYVFDWNSYKFGSDYSLSKYCDYSGYGNVDNKRELDPEDDAATANWGDGWVTPTSDQLRELMDKCSWTYKKQNGVFGFEAKGPNGKTIFFADFGCKYGQNINNDNMIMSRNGCNLWSNFLALWYNDYNKRMDIYIAGSDRIYGMSVRPVRK